MKEFKHEVALMNKEVYAAIRTYLMKHRPKLPDIEKAITCNIEVGQKSTIFKWEVAEEGLDEILGLKESK